MKVYRKLHNEEINRRRRELYNEKKKSWYLLYIYNNNNKVSIFNIMKLSENRIRQIIRETIEEATFGNVDQFTPYTPEEREQNFKGLSRMGNPSYDAFKAWSEEGLKRGIPPIQLSWNNYIKQK